MRLEEILSEQADTTVTPYALKTLDYLVPGSWHGTVDLNELVALHTELDDDEDIADVARYARLEFDRGDKHYGTAMKIFASVDTLDKVAAGAALASKVGDAFDFAKILKKFTPKSDTTQAIDAGLKLVAEIVAFGLLRGMPKMDLDGLKQYTGELTAYASQDRMRLAAWVVIDGLLPLGPEFMTIIAEKVQSAGSAITNSAIFGKIAAYLPGTSNEEKTGFVSKAIASVNGWVNGFVAEHGLTREKAMDALGKAVNIVDDSFDVIAATLDLTTNYFEYTGAQTVARTAIAAGFEQWEADQHAAAEAAAAFAHTQAVAAEATARAAAEAQAEAEAEAEDDAREQAAAIAGKFTQTVVGKRRKPSDFRRGKRRGGHRRGRRTARAALGRDRRKPGRLTPDDILVEVVAAAALCDKRADTEEGQIIEDNIVRMDYFKDMDTEEVRQTVVAAFRRVYKHGVDGVLLRAARLAHTHLAADAFVLAAIVQDIDDAQSRAEGHFIAQLRQALQLDDALADALIDEVHFDA